MEDKKTLRPGDPGYQGGITTTDVHAYGQDRRVYTVKDENGNIVSVTERPLFLGLFQWDVELQSKVFKVQLLTGSRNMTILKAIP